MKNSRPIQKSTFILHFLSIFIILSVLLTGVNTNARAKGITKEDLSNSISQQKINQCLGEQSNATTHPLTGKITFIGSRANKPIQQINTAMRTVNAETAARGYLTDCGSLFGLSNQAAELAVERNRKTEDGRSIIRFQQKYQGLPVFGGELLIQLNKTNDVILVNGSILPDLKLSTLPGIDATTAQQIALQSVADKYQIQVDSLKTSDATLMIYSPELIQSTSSGRAVLVWQMEVTPYEMAPIREMVFIDTNKGSVVLNYNQIDTALNRITYTAVNTLTQPGTLVCDESDPTCSAGDADAKGAHIYGGDTYNFYFDNHGRDSIDGNGMAMISTVHYDTGYCNAFWDGIQMTYGDGCFIVTNDVVAHEMTHGVTEKESHLYYMNQSGAINESFSDIWGEFIDQSYSHGAGDTDTLAVKWVVGEDVSIGSFRDMKDPTINGDPDRMSSLDFAADHVPGSILDDNGGVHTNSGVGNKAAYLITDGTTDEPGGTFNGYTITGLGITKTADIYYEVQTNILISTSNYHSLYDALNQACTTLIGGTSGITSGDCIEVNKATLATEMDSLALPPSPPANDDFANAITIPSSSFAYTNSQDITGATSKGDDPIFSCPPPYQSGQAENSVWYQFTPLSSGIISVDTLGSDFDSVLNVWTGNNPDSLIPINCNDDINPSLGNYQSSLTINATAGQTYRIELANYFFEGISTNLAINFKFTPSTFIDVPQNAFAWAQIESLYANGITGGCVLSPLSYCPDNSVTRAQMAVFLLKGLHGSGFTPPALGGSTGFSDVSTSYWAAAWIKQLALESITGGCGNGNYCPENIVTRDQMAVFLLKAKHGTSYAPPVIGAGSGFNDVPVDYWSGAWIKQLAFEGITGGCGAGNYCPSTPVTRAQMAVFLQRTFNLAFPIP